MKGKEIKKATKVITDFKQPFLYKTISHPHMGYLTDYSEVLNLLIQDFLPLIDCVYLVDLSDIHIYVKLRVGRFKKI